MVYLLFFVFSPRVGRHQPKMSESLTIYVHITLFYLMVKLPSQKKYVHLKDNQARLTQHQYGNSRIVSEDNCEYKGEGEPYLGNRR